MISLIVSIMVALILVGALLWLVKQLPGIDEGIKALFSKAVIIIAALCILFYLLAAFGVLGHGHDIPVPQLR